jgi:hypothetical protein
VTNVVDPNNAEFEPRGHFIAYFDILGYEEHVKEKGDATVLAQIINHNVMNYKKSFTSDIFFEKTPEYNIKLKVFSDNFIICSERNWFTVMSSTSTMQRMLIENDIFIRGSLCYGDLMFSNEFVCGQGIVDAYKLESQIALFPRVVIDDRFIDEATKGKDDFANALVRKAREIQPNLTVTKSDLENLNSEVLEFESNIRTDFDGNKFIDYLNAVHRISLEKNELGRDNSYVAYYLAIHTKKLSENIEKYASNRRILQKYKWCKTYHNDFCRQHNLIDFIIE